MASSLSTRAAAGPQDIQGLRESDLESLDDPERCPVLWARKKQTAQQAVEGGDSTANPICMSDAVTILRARIEAACVRDGLLFPAWGGVGCSSIIREFGPRTSAGRGRATPDVEPHVAH